MRTTPFFRAIIKIINGEIMFNLEKAIKEWKKGLRKNGSLEDGYITELESHLRDEVEEAVREGKGEETAFYEAVKAFGEADNIGEEFYKTDSTHLNKRPPWKKSKWMPSLLLHYLKIARRNLTRRKGFALINIFGLALGLACTMLITLWILNELSFNSFHHNADNIYGIVSKFKFGDTDAMFSETPAPLAAAMKESYAEIKNVTRYFGPTRQIISAEDKSLYTESISFADSSFLDIFDFKLKYGDRKNALTNPNSVIITEKFAEKYFGKVNPVGRVLRLNNEYNLIVTGLLEEIPSNSSLQFEALISFNTYIEAARKTEPDWPDSWFDNSIQTYVQLSPQTDVNVFRNKINDFIYKRTATVKTRIQTSIVPIKEIHFSPYYNNEGRMSEIINFSIIAFCVLLIACLNFMNLSIISTMRRSVEIGLRKVVGATKINAVIQFFSEFILITLISFILAFMIMILILPGFNSLFYKELKLDLFFRGPSILAIAGIFILTAFIGGGYPALFISSLKPVLIFRNRMALGNNKLILRKFLVVFQFFISITLIIVISVIYLQLNFMKGKNPGFDKSQILFLRLNGNTQKNYQALKNALTGKPGIENVTGCNSLPTEISGRYLRMSWKGKDKITKPIVYKANVDYDFFETMNIPMIKGNKFSRDRQAESENSVIVNEEMVKLMKMKDVIGEYLTLKEWNSPVKIIGVMKDFHSLPLREKIPPLVFKITSDTSYQTSPHYQLIKISPGKTVSAMDIIKTEWNKLNPSYPFEYQFLDEQFNAMYDDENRYSYIIGSFALMAIFISALGLFGLASYTAEQRKKEIAIRKVVGSGIGEVIRLLLKEYFYLIMIANLLAWPLGYYLSVKWLQDYNYRINIGWEIFLITSLAAIIIVVLSVGYQSLKAATANPVKSLRSE
jgi:putative ABC transport system permease protein